MAGIQQIFKTCDEFYKEHNCNVTAPRISQLGILTKSWFSEDNVIPCFLPTDSLPISSLRLLVISGTEKRVGLLFRPLNILSMHSIYYQSNKSISIDTEWFLLLLKQFSTRVYLKGKQHMFKKKNTCTEMINFYFYLNPVLSNVHQM